MKKEKIVMGFGTFDTVHPGHLFYFQELKKLGDKLIVIIARDHNVKKIKGQLPLFGEQHRLEDVKKSGIPDEVILGHESDFYEVIRKFKPDILGFGYDQRVNEEDVQKHFPHIKMVRIGSYYPEKYKSSLIKKKLPQAK